MFNGHFSEIMLRAWRGADEVAGPPFLPTRNCLRASADKSLRKNGPHAGTDATGIVDVDLSSNQPTRIHPHCLASAKDGAEVSRRTDVIQDQVQISWLERHFNEWLPPLLGGNDDSLRFSVPA
jgi:hypothetical protein